MSSEKILRGLRKVSFGIARKLLRPIELIRPRIYMKMYIKLLRVSGINFKGSPRYISSSVYFDDFGLITIGDRVVISADVVMLTHDYSVTTALIANGYAPATDIGLKKSIEIGNNVFVGLGTILLPGVRIHDNVIIGAGSVVRGEILGDSLVIGNPASRIGALTDDPERWRRKASSPGAMADRE